ncbi:MAG: SIS domain-containing protein [Proteobacteria bacterium]|nr:SIS domain-containing protein [Pseudomonadota bacterium]MYJ95139.1 SIS domain-containing protein [Pseudomonadota bacterium]
MNRPDNQTRMFAEAASAPHAVRRLVDSSATRVRKLADEVAAFDPALVVTCGRGSSDHAATYAKYLFEPRLGLATSSAAPSVSSVHGVKLNLVRALYIAISQSGASPDIVSHATMARDQGAMVVALVNDPESALAGIARHVVPLGAGPETSVAATKSYLVSLAALALFASYLGNDTRLLEALRAVPEAMAEAWQCDWGALLDTLKTASNLFVVGRGVGYALALEAALKLKETARLHAEAHSSAEVRHGPLAMVGDGFPLLVFAQDDAAQESVLRLAEDAVELGARVFVAGARHSRAIALPCPQSPHALLAPLVQAQCFYRFANSLALARGLDPDAPPHLSKVTRTV